MKTLCLLLSLLPLLCHAAEPTLKDLLQQGLMAEEAEGDLAKAAKAYESLVNAGDAQQKLVATGIYRLAEVRRKQDKKDDAIKIYQRLITEFPGQETLVKMARENLTAMGASLPAVAAEAPPADDPESKEIARMQKLLSESPDRARAERPLHMAAEKGWKRLLEAMIAKGFDVNQAGRTQSDENDRSPLAIAARDGNKAVAELLLAHGADVNDGRSKTSEIEDDYSISNLPLTLAINNKRLETLKLLLDHGASLAIRARLDNSVGGRPLHLAINARSLPLVKILLDHHADLEAVTTAISNATRDSQSLPLGVTPLGLASRRGEKDSTEALIAAGANINASDEAGRTPVFEAYFYDDGKYTMDLVTPLIEHGASLTVRDKVGRTPLAHLFATTERERQKLPYLLQMNLSKAKLLLARGADPKVTDNEGNTLLHLRAMDGDFGGRYGMPGSPKVSDDVDAWLTTLGIDPSLKNKKGETALDLTLRSPRISSPLSLWLVARTATKDYGVWDCTLSADTILTSLYVPLSETEPLPSLAEFALLHMAQQTHAAHPAVPGMPDNKPEAVVRVLHHPGPGMPTDKLVESFDLAKDDPGLYKPLQPGDAVFIPDNWDRAATETLLAKQNLTIMVSYSGVERRFRLGGDDIWDPMEPELPWGLWPEILRPLVASIAPVDLTKVKLVRQVNGKAVERIMNLASGIANSWLRVMNGDRIELVASGSPVDATNGVTISLPDLGLIFVDVDEQWSAPLSSVLRNILPVSPPGRDWSHLKIWQANRKDALIFDLASAAGSMGPDSDPETLLKYEPKMNPGDRIEIPVLPGHEAEPMNDAVKSYLQRVAGQNRIPPGIIQAAPPVRRRNVNLPRQP